MTLFDEVAGVLSHHGVAHALIGASALAAYGVSRSTVDQDLLVVDRQVLEPRFWSAIDRDVKIDARRGDGDDPLAGVVRLSKAGDRDVDVVVGRHQWQADILSRAVVLKGKGVCVVEAADLILMKLYAGGAQDKWDIEQLLGVHTDAGMLAAVDERIGALPQHSRDMWVTLRPKS